VLSACVRCVCVHQGARLGVCVTVRWHRKVLCPSVVDVWKPSACMRDSWAVARSMVTRQASTTCLCVCALNSLAVHE
jgi:hypothetical protein